MKSKVKDALIIALITTVLAALGSVFLIWKGFVVFDWSNAYMAEMEYEKNKAKSKRVLVLGDSQLEEWPLEHCLYTDLANYCRKHDLGMVNAAHHGFGPIEYRDRLAQLGSDYDPDLILIFHYVGNDLSDTFYRQDDDPKQPTHNATYVIGDQEEPAPNPTAVEQDSNASAVSEDVPPQPLGDQFDWEKFEDCGVDPLYIEYAKNRILYPGRVGKEYVNPHLLVFSCWKPMFLTDNVKLESPASRNAWYKTLLQYEAILEQANAIGADVHIVLIPTTVQVDSSHFEFYRRLAFDVPEDLMSSRVPQDLMQEFADFSNAACMDLLPTFKEQTNTGALYFENDDHLSQIGHELAFERVKSEILDPYLQDNDGKVSRYRVANFSNRYYKWKMEYKMDELQKRLTK